MVKLYHFGGPKTLIWHTAHLSLSDMTWFWSIWFIRFSLTHLAHVIARFDPFAHVIGKYLQKRKEKKKGFRCETVWQKMETIS